MYLKKKLLNVFFNYPVYLELHNGSFYAFRKNVDEISMRMSVIPENDDMDVARVLNFLLERFFPEIVLVKPFFVINLCDSTYEVSSIINSVKAHEINCLVVSTPRLAPEDFSNPNKIRSNILFRDKFVPGWRAFLPIIVLLVLVCTVGVMPAISNIFIFALCMVLIFLMLKNKNE